MSQSRRIRPICIGTLGAVALAGVASWAWNGFGLWRTMRQHERVRVLAANLANDEFHQRFGRRPFRPEMYEPELRRGRWYWGSFQPAAFFSAEVSFRRDTTDPQVRIFWATDGVESRDTGFEQPVAPAIPNLPVPTLIDR